MRLWKCITLKKTYDMDFERMKTDWRTSAREIKAYSGTGKDFDFRRKDSLGRLAARYKRFIIIECIAAIGIYPFYFRMSDSFPKITLGLCFATLAYFALCALIDTWLLNAIRSIDCSRMTVEEVITQSMLCRKRHLQSIMLLLPLAFGLIFYIALCYDADRFALYGVIAGAVTGVLIGINQLLSFLRDYRCTMD